jgi:hypothetical protein
MAALSSTFRHEHSRGATRSRLRHAVVSALAVTGVLSVGACRSNPTVAITLDLSEMGSGYQASGKHWLQFGAFANSKCEPFLKRLALGGLPAIGAVRGLPAIGAVRGLSFLLGTPAPTVGDLPKGDYALVAVIKNRDCGVEGIGCRTLTAVESGNGGAIQIKIGKVDGGGRCEAGQCCSYGRCVEGPGCGVTEPGQGFVAPTAAHADETLIELQIEGLPQNKQIDSSPMHPIPRRSRFLKIAALTFARLSEAQNSGLQASHSASFCRSVSVGSSGPGGIEVFAPADRS